MIISLLQEKGGCGKTTVAINLAKAIQKQGHSVLFVDSDPQGSARDWHARGNGAELDLIALDRPTIDKDVVKFRHAYDFIIIDGAPRLSSMLAKTLLCSDLVLIPVQPSPFDIWAASTAVNLLKDRQEITGGFPQSAFLLNRKITNSRMGKQASEILSQYGLPVLNSSISDRVAYKDSIALGETVMNNKRSYQKGATEINLFLEEIMKTYYINKEVAA